MNKLSLIFCSILFAATTCEKVIDADIKNFVSNYENRIINGQVARTGQFPWQVGVICQLRGSSRSNFCGGSLIASDWVLTAAHCVKDADRCTLLFGAINITSASQPGLIVRRSDGVVIHEEFDPITLNNDVGLVALKDSVRYYDNIQAISLADPNDYTPENVRVTVSGWGRTASGAQQSPVLNYVDLVTISNKVCQEVYENQITNATLCCRGDWIESTCFGDSGGPLIERKDDGRFVHIGIISFIYSEWCESGKPSGYMRTSSYRGWIERNMNSYKRSAASTNKYVYSLLFMLTIILIRGEFVQVL